MNYFKTSLLLASLTALFMFIGYSLGGSGGAIIALFLAGGMNFFAYWNSDKVVLKMSGAVLAEKSQYKEYYNIVEVLVKKANLPMPKLYVLNEQIPNAFATGRNPQNAAVGVTVGILDLLSQEELSGVIAHELAHIEHRDTLISTISATFAGAISMIANMLMFMNIFGGRGENRPNMLVSLIVMIVAPLVATIIQMAVSRNREYYADKRGGEICGNPLYLASALSKLESFSNVVRNNKASFSEAQKKSTSTAHMQIVNHFGGGDSDSLFSTHPNTKNRIIELEKQALELGIKEYEVDKSLTNLKNDISKDLLSDGHIKNNPWNTL